jgi:hypothetical protein
MPIKTIKQCNKSGKDFDEFFEPLDEVDEALIDHINYYVPARFTDNIFIQCGEAETEINGLLYYTTFCKKGDKYYFLGYLPKFKQPKYKK